MTEKTRKVLDILIANFPDDLKLFVDCFAAAVMNDTTIELNNLLVDFARKQLRIREIGEE